MIKRRHIIAVMPVLAVFNSMPAYAERVEDNLQVMLEAARKLEFSSADEGARAFLLVKQEVVTAPVAAIFGYADNGDACEDLALTLSTSGRDGTFKCQPIY